ncbi:MAG TPA: polysaccharide biosynthesis tyrosine autokinase, partial [bacterium]|nr:polysaccharide biosynthesis tyrosine autokinase [bacterium]
DEQGEIKFTQKIKQFFDSLLGDNGDADIPEDELENQRIFKIVEIIRNSISIEPIRNTDMINISMTALTPAEAAYLTNTIATVYQEQNQQESREEVRRVKDFLEDQLDIFQQQLAKSEQQLKEYKERERFVALPREIEEMVTKLAEFESMYHAAQLELNSNKERLAYIDEQLDKNRQNINMENVLSAPFLKELSQQMAEMETERAKYIALLMDEGVYDPNKPDHNLRKYEERARVLSERYKSEVSQLVASETLDPVWLSESFLQRKLEVEAVIQSLLPKVKALKAIVDDFNTQLEKIPERALKLARLERSAMLDEKITLMMKEKYEEARISEVGQLGNIRIVDPAQPNYVPIRPKKKLNMMLGVIVGLGLGIGISFLIDYFDNSIRSVQDIERLGMTLLGSIPVIELDEAVMKGGKNGNHKFKRSMNVEENRIVASRLITQFAPKSPISEAYRSLRTSIQYSITDNPIKSIVLTSAGPKEGKSTTVINLAISIAHMGTKVLLVDTDLRRPVIHSIFNLDKSRGISNYLVGRVTLDEVVSETEIDNLYVLPSGTLPPNPSELLGSKAMKNCIDELKTKFDLLLFDSPPIMAVTDAVVLSSEVDAVIMVIKDGQTNRDAALRCYDILKKAPNRLLGVVLNGIQVNGFYGYYYYYYQYNYYQKEKTPKRKYFKKKNVHY